jgi:predicted RND superfamily exporter protein
MILIFGMMFIDFRSLSLGFISILPNVFPILLNFGLMGLLSIRLDSATAMISDIGIGIIVDDTIHFFHSFKEELKATGDYRQAVFKSFSIKGTPTIITSIILILGFGVVGFSKFMPTFYFGVLSAILIFNGLWSELLLSPALLMWIRPRFGKESRS